MRVLCYYVYKNHKTLEIMKKIAVTMIAALMAFAAHAQDIQYGIRGGLNLSKESDHILNVMNYGQIDLETDFRPGLNIGGLVNVSTGRNFELEAGLSYSMLGYKDKIYDGAELNDYFYAQVMSHYLTIPIAEKYYPFGDGLYVEFGPQFGFLLSKRSKLRDGEAYHPFKGNNRTFDFAILGGLGYRFPNNIFVDARYVHSFTETCKLYEGGRNRNIQVSLGYLF